MSRAVRWLAPVAAGLVRALGSTWRRREEGPESVRPGRAIRDERFLYLIWHRAIFGHCYLYRDLGICIGVSEHGDGEIGARIAQSMGFVTARGSSTRGAGRLIREMVQHAESGAGDLALTPDGPRGPACRTKPGIVYLAARLGWKIVPAALAARPAKVFHSWDRFLLPYPFARVAAVLGEPVEVSPEPGAEAVKECCRMLDRRMEQAQEQAERLVGA